MDASRVLNKTQEKLILIDMTGKAWESMSKRQLRTDCLGKENLKKLTIF